MINDNDLDLSSARLVKDETFFSFEEDLRSGVYEFFPTVHGDSRGWFSEVLKGDLSWMKQINRSSSSANVVRGCHAQRGEWCQAKLVEAINEVIFDFIIDARPDSQTFGTSKVYRLDPEKQNKLFVPRGFLHAFIVPSSARENAIFNYYCDNTYNKASEICINPKSIIPGNVGILRSWCNDPDKSELKKMFKELVESDEENWKYSEKDLVGEDYNTWMTSLKNAHSIGDFKTSLWYKEIMK